MTLENNVMGCSTIAASGSFRFSATIPAAKAKIEPAMTSASSTTLSNAAALMARDGMST